jgi:hypothetical protein
MWILVSGFTIWKKNATNTSVLKALSPSIEAVQYKKM